MIGQLSCTVMVTADSTFELFLVATLKGKTSVAGDSVGGYSKLIHKLFLPFHDSVPAFVADNSASRP